MKIKGKRVCIPGIFKGKHTFMVLFLWGALTLLASPKKQNPSPTLVLQSANSNENSYINGEFISILRENVVFTYDDITIRSDEATWWRNQGIISFKDNIKVKRGSSVLSCL